MAVADSGLVKPELFDDEYVAVLVRFDGHAPPTERPPMFYLTMHQVFATLVLPSAPGQLHSLTMMPRNRMLATFYVPQTSDSVPTVLCHVIDCAENPVGAAVRDACLMRKTALHRTDFPLLSRDGEEGSSSSSDDEEDDVPPLNSFDVDSEEEDASQSRTNDGDEEVKVPPAASYYVDSGSDEDITFGDVLVVDESSSSSHVSAISTDVIKRMVGSRRGDLKKVTLLADSGFGHIGMALMIGSTSHNIYQSADDVFWYSLYRNFKTKESKIKGTSVAKRPSRKKRCLVM